MSKHKVSLSFSHYFWVLQTIYNVNEFYCNTIIIDRCFAKPMTLLRPNSKTFRSRRAHIMIRSCQNNIGSYFSSRRRKVPLIRFVFFCLFSEKELITPPLNGLILPGITRNSILTLAREWNEFKISERTITMGEVCHLLSENRVRFSPWIAH